MRKILILLSVIIGLTVQSQTNLITNSTNWNDSTNDGLADGWFVSSFATETNVDSGFQYVASIGSTCQEILLGQVLNIPITTPRIYKLDFDMENNCIMVVYLQIIPGSGYIPLFINPGNMQHYTLTFTYTEPLFYALCFLDYAAQDGWMKIDNVVLIELNSVDINELQNNENNKNNEIYNLLGQKLKNKPDHGYFIQNNKTYLK